MDKQAILDRFAFYKAASPFLRSQITTAAEYANLPDGAYFHHEGDLCNHFALVGIGNIRVFRTDNKGHEITLYHVQDAQPCLVNMLCVFLRRPAMANAVAEIRTEAVIIPGESFRYWVETESVIRQFVFESMATRLADVLTLADQLAFHKLDQRVAHVLLDRFANQGRPLRILTVTHEDLAKELGSAREVVSRVLKELERAGAIRTSRGQVELIDREALLRLLRPHFSPVDD